MRRLSVATAVVLLLAVVVENARGVVQYNVTDLGTLGGTQSQAWAINDNGLVVGFAEGAHGRHGFLYNGSTMQDLGTLGGTDYDGSDARSINSSGSIVGFAETSAGTQDAYLYNGSTMTNLGTLGGTASHTMESRAYGINDSGQVVGWALTTNGSHAFLYNGTTMKDLGTLGGDQSEAWLSIITDWLWEGRGPLCIIAPFCTTARR